MNIFKTIVVLAYLLSLAFTILDYSITYTKGQDWFNEGNALMAVMWRYTGDMGFWATACVEVSLYFLVFISHVNYEQYSLLLIILFMTLAMAHYAGWSSWGGRLIGMV